MKRIALLALATAFVVACQDGQLPTDAPDLKKGGVPAPQAQINRLINQLFSQPEKAEAHGLASVMKDALSDGDTDGAVAAAFALIELGAGVALSPSQQDLLQDLTELLLDFVDYLDPQDPTVGVGIISPTGGIVTTNSNPDPGIGNAGIQVDATGVLEPVVIIIQKLGPQCLEIDNPQSDDCWSFTSIPPDIAFEIPALIAECIELSTFGPLPNRPVGGILKEGQEGLVRLHAQDVIDEQVVVKALPPADGPVGFIECDDQGPEESSGFLGAVQRGWRSFENRVASLLAPDPLFASAAASGGVTYTGRKGSLTDIAAALPAEMDYENLGDETRTAEQGATLTTRVLVTDADEGLVQGATVRFETTDGVSTVDSAEVLTNASGIAEVQWTVGSDVGAEYTLRAYAIGIADPDDDGVFASDAMEVTLGTGELFFTATVEFNDGFEVESGWTTTGFWHRSTLVSGGSPIINKAFTDQLVNLALNDVSGGAMPTPAGGDYVFWYGEEADGNYIGTRDNSVQGSGGTSTTANSGTLTSPVIVIPDVDVEGDAFLRFDTWFEIESVDPDAFDLMEVIVEEVDGPTTSLGFLNPPPEEDPDGGAPTPLTSSGFNTAPVWFGVVQPMNAFRGKSVVLRFEFNTVDVRYNGFRGWLVDNVRVELEEVVEASIAASVMAGSSSTSGLNPPRPPRSRDPGGN